MPYLITSAIPAANSRSGSVDRQFSIDDNGFRLIEGTDHVLTQRMVNCGFTTN